MKHLTTTIMTIGLALALAGCGVSRTQFENARAAAESPSVRASEIKKCTVAIAGKSATQRANIAALMNVSVASVPKVFCTRVINAAVSGRISYDDYRNARSGGDMTRIIRVLRGR